MASENTTLFTPRAPIFGGRGALFAGKSRLFTPGHQARPLTTQDGFKLTTQNGRPFIVQGRATP